MGRVSAIEWTDATCNFWRGCHKVGPGCAYCYMFRDQARYGRDPGVVVRCSPAVFNAPLSAKWRALARELARLEDRRMRVFTCSWSDFFHEDADPWRAEAWEVIRACPQYDWQILTKRPERIVDCLPPGWDAGWPHVWMGVSIENRRFVDRAYLLRETPCAVRFISAEPLLGPLRAPARTVTFSTVPGSSGVRAHWPDGFAGPELDLTGIDWLIVGGESGGPAARALVGPGAAPLEAKLGWVRDLRDATRCQACQGSGRDRFTYTIGGKPHRVDVRACAHCRGTGQGRTAFLFKQWGGRRPTSGGRELDGRTWDEFPASVIDGTTAPEPLAVEAPRAC